MAWRGMMIGWPVAGGRQRDRHGVALRTEQHVFLPAVSDHFFMNIAKRYGRFQRDFGLIGRGALAYGRIAIPACAIVAGLGAGAGRMIRDHVARLGATAPGLRLRKR